MAVAITPFTSVAVFGGLAVDRNGTTAATPTLGASNPGRVRATPGSASFNVAKTFARLNLGVRLGGAVGNDADGAKTLAALQTAEIDASGTVVDPRRATATYHAVFDDRGGLVIGVADTGIYEALTPSALADAARAAQSDGMWIIDANFSPETPAFSRFSSRLRPSGSSTADPAGHIEAAVAKAAAAGISGKAVTPFPLDAISRLTGERALAPTPPW